MKRLGAAFKRTCVKTCAESFERRKRAFARAQSTRETGRPAVEAAIAELLAVERQLEEIRAASAAV